MKPTIIALTTLALLGSACGSMKKEEKHRLERQAMEEQSKKQVRDAEITNMVMTANTEEMQMARLAKERAENRDVKRFAEKMFKEHSKNNDQAQALAETAMLPKETRPSMELKFASEDRVEELKMMKGKVFDRAYMREQVSMHNKFLQTIEFDLLPEVRSLELRSMLLKTQKDVKEHLREAEKIQSKL